MTSPSDRLFSAPAVILGASGLGAREEHVDMAAARALIASEHTVVDTSNNYGGSRSEVVIGAAIAELGGLPPGKRVISKADCDGETGAFDRDRVLRSFEESITRLGLETLPLYQLHDPYTITFAEAMGPRGAVAGLVELREQGLVGAIGVAAGPTAMLTEYVRTGAFEVLLSHNRYTLVDRSAGDLFAEAAERGMAVFNAAPFGGGILAGGAPEYCYAAASAELVAWVERLRAVCAEFDVAMAAAALGFSLRNPNVSSTLVGVPTPDRVAALDALIDTELPEDLWAAIDALGTPPSTLTD